MTLPNKAGWRGAALPALAVAAYWPVFRAGFVWDDDTALTRNPVVLAADGLRTAWLSTHAVDYWPVTYSSFWVEWRLWGAHPLGYHAVNLALHIGVCLLLWAVLRALRIPGAWLGAALFAVHPVNVESVAWIAERKNLLAAVFYLGAILAFVKRRTWLSLLLFTLGLLSKGSIAPLPLVLAGILVAQRRTERSEWLKLLPFFGVAVLLVLVNIWFQTHGTGAVFRHAGPWERVLGAASVVWLYLSKAVWPFHLSFVYAQQRFDPSHPAAWAGLGALTLALIYTWRRRSSPWIWPWLYFIALLIPVMGLVDVYFMRYALVADHYQYLALMGISAAAGAAIALLTARWGSAILVVPAIVLPAFALLTFRQARAYRDAPTLYRTVLAQNSNAWLAHNNLGVLLLADPSTYPEAERHFRAALALDPDSSEPRDNLGDTLGREGKSAEAESLLQESLRGDPADASAHNDLGKVYFNGQRLQDAANEFEAAYRLHPDRGEFRNNLGRTYLHLGDAALAAARRQAARDDYARAIAVDPTLVAAHNNLGNLLFQDGRLPDAIAEYEAALRLDPVYARARQNLELARRAAAEAAQNTPRTPSS